MNLTKPPAKWCLFFPKQIMPLQKQTILQDICIASQTL